MTYHDMAHFAQTFGLLFFIAMFCAIVAYALWPANKADFDHAARLALDDDGDAMRASQPAKDHHA